MGSEHRDDILTAATDIFARFGFKKASIEDIARRAGIGKGTVYRHFESKEELFAAVIRRIGVHARADLDAIVKQARTPAAKVRAYLEGRNRYYVQLAADLRMSPDSLVELFAHAEPLRSGPQALEATPLADIIEDGNARGAFAVQRPGMVSTGISALLHGADVFLVGPDASEMQEALAEVHEVFLRGLLAVPRSTATQEG